MQITQFALDGVLTNKTATGATFDPAATFVGVATAVVNNGLATTSGNVTVASGAMSALQAVSAWGSVNHMLNGVSTRDSPRLSFRPASSAEAQTIVAWFLGSTSGIGNLLGFGIVQPSIAMKDQYSEIGIVVRIAEDPSGIQDVSVIYNG